MIYPYTIVKRLDIPNIAEILQSFGYKCYENIDLYQLLYKEDTLFCIVVNDINNFGRIGFYLQGGLDKRIKRRYIKDVHAFLRRCAILHGELEF